MKLNLILLFLCILIIRSNIVIASETATMLPSGTCDEGTIECNLYGGQIIICRNNSWNFLKFCSDVCAYNGTEPYCIEYQQVLEAKLIRVYTDPFSLLLYFCIVLLFIFSRRSKKNYAFRGLVIGLILGYFIGLISMLSIGLMLFGTDSIISGISSGAILEIILPNLFIVAVSGAVGSLLGARKKK